MSHTESNDTSWQSIYRLGGAAAVMAVLIAVAEIGITFLPGGQMSDGALSVVDWFRLFHTNWFMGLRNLGLLNIGFNVMELLIFFALYGAHRRMNQAYGALALILAVLGVAVFFATNRAFAMLALSSQYAAATTDAQRAVLEAAGQAMLSVGQSHTPGTFMAFVLSETAGLTISMVMLREHLFSRASAYAGIGGFGLLLIFEVVSSFIPAWSGVAMVTAMLGGLLTMAWYSLIAWRLFQLGHLETAATIMLKPVVA